LIRTFSTRVQKQDDSHANLLESFASLMSTAERKIHAWLKAGKEWNASAYAPLYRELGLSAVMFRMARNSLDGKLRSISELAKLDAELLATRIKSKKKQIAAKKGAVTKARNSIGTLEPKLVSTMDDIAGHKQRLAEAKSEAARQREVAALKKRLVKRHLQEKEIKALRSRVSRLQRDLHQHGRRNSDCNVRLLAQKTRRSASGRKSCSASSFSSMRTATPITSSGSRTGAARGGAALRSWGPPPCRRETKWPSCRFAKTAGSILSCECRRRFEVMQIVGIRFPATRSHQ
jgi:hypothetical protein